jgi:uncharacterized BrkB/YihY/UPF0761 family membrane protein
MQLIKKAEQKGNQPRCRWREDLGLVDFFKLTSRRLGEDHVSAFAGNLTYKTLFAIFPFFTFCSRCWGSSTPLAWSTT